MCASAFEGKNLVIFPQTHGKTHPHLTHTAVSPILILIFWSKGVRETRMIAVCGFRTQFHLLQSACGPQIFYFLIQL